MFAWKNVLVFIVIICCAIWLVGSQFTECHDDAIYNPSGVVDTLDFSWLGVLQYIHIKNGTPHYFRVPRVVMIARQFAISTAADAAQVPTGYALGNIILGDYERDENECKLSLDEIAAGAECLPATLMMPIADVLLHPEYKHFGAKDSLAILKLIKPIQSFYMVPACIPFKNHILTKDRRQSPGKFYHLDYNTDVPRNFAEEEKEVTKLSLLPRELCYLYDEVEGKNNTNFVKNRMVCTTGCGMHSGAPSLVHERTGHWTIVAIAIGGSPCVDPLRPRRPPSPPRHLLIYPYLSWITAAISGKPIGTFAKDDPFGIMMPRAEGVTNLHDLMFHEWVGHFWMGGPRCHDRGDVASDLFMFYHEVFTIKSSTETFFNYVLDLDTAPGTFIVCMKVGMPYRMGKPHVQDLNTPSVRVTIPLIHLFSVYRFQLVSFAYNYTTSTVSSGTSSCGTGECSGDE